MLQRALLTLLWVLATVVPTAARADASRWTGFSDPLFTHHTEAETASGTSIAQDGSQFIWVGTQNGLARWDGYHFRRYAADFQTPGALPDGFILALYVDERGRLWVGTSAGGLARYDAERDAFVVTSSSSGLSDPAVSAITGDGNGGLWIGTGVGLDHMDAHGVVQRAPTDPAHVYGLPEGSVNAILSGHDGTLWVGTAHGLWRRSAGSSAAFTFLPLGTEEGAAPTITELYQDSANRVWVATRGHGAFVIVGGSARAVHESGAVSTLESDRVTSIMEARPGEVWLATYGGGIVVVDAQSGTTHRIRHYPDTPLSLYDNFVYALYRDRSGLIWVSTIAATSQHDPLQQGVLTLFGATGRQDGISGKKVFVVAPMPDGRVWLGVDGGIDIIDPTLGRLGQIVPDPAHPESALPTGRIQSIAIGDGGSVYIATQQGLYRTDTSGRHLVRVNVPDRSPTASIRELRFVGDVLWLGGEFDGLWALDLHVPEKPVVRMHDAGTRLGDPRIASIDRGAGNTLWVGTRKGLARLDMVTGEIERVPVDANDPSQLPGGFVASTLTDRRGRLWVASFGAGVQMLERRDADGRWHFRRFGLREGLPHLGVDKLLEDAQGNIWAATDDGLAVIDGKSFAIRSLQMPEGVGLRTFFTSSGAATAANEMLFGGEGGLVVVRPELVTRWEYTPPVVVTDVSAGSSRLPGGGFNRMGGAPRRLEISPNDHRLRVEFSALDYSAPGRNRYAYRLQGFDADWIATEPSSRVASYTNLPPGHYTLQLRGSNSNGAWSQPLEMPIRVLPLWYQTLTFRLTALLITLGLVAALVHARTAYLRRRQRELQSLVTERTAELEQRSQQLRESQLQLERIAYVDPLTGLSNRRLFEKELRHGIAMVTRGGGCLTLLLLDLDGFKKINDQLGHDAGDALLVETALRLTHSVRETDHVARLGGDEFAIVLTGACELATVEVICRRILTSIAAPVSYKDATLQISASIGSVQCPSQGTETELLYKSADVALYEAKRSGRNTWRWSGQTAVEQRVSTAAAGVSTAAEDEVVRP
jgi:diguanylate cyclase (GGDEF)-like protein